MMGFFVTLEGVEGAGKTTQMALLRDSLAAEGRKVVSLREPGGDEVAEAIRRLLLTSDAVAPRAELLLFLASRAQNTERLIRPRLEEGAVVVCDRYADSTIAYQGYGRGGDVEQIRLLNRYATGGLVPDLTVLLDLDPRIGLGRQAERNRMESEPIEFHARVRGGFLAEARRDPVRFAVVDAAADPAEVHRRVNEAVARALANESARRSTGT